MQRSLDAHPSFRLPALSTVYCLCCNGATPYGAGLSPVQVMAAKMREAEQGAPPALPPHVPPRLRAFIRRCCENDADRRWVFFSAQPLGCMVQAVGLQ